MSAQDGAPARRLRSLAAHIIPSAASGADGDAPKPKLLYFNSVGKCYGVRMAMFAAFGKDGWEDHRVRGGMAGDEWKELQPVLESGSLPELTLPGGEVVCQSHAIARYAGAMSRGAGHDLYPVDPGQAVLVDEARLPPAPPLAPHLSEKVHPTWPTSPCRADRRLRARGAGEGAAWPGSARGLLPRRIPREGSQAHGA